MTDNNATAEALKAIARRLERYARNIEILWDGMKETVTYADRPLDVMLNITAADVRAIAEALSEGEGDAES